MTKQILSPETLTSDERLIYNKIFETGDVMSLFALKNTFSPLIGPLKKHVIELLHQKNLIEKRGLSLRILLLVFGGISFFLSLFFLAPLSITGMTAGLVTTVILIVFGFIMPKRQMKGAEVNWQMRGLKLYMNTAEKYRQKFYEKEGIFETLLPYAIIFGITKEWIKKIEDIYEGTYFQNYHPVWFMTSGVDNFDVGNFTTRLESLSSSIAANTGTSSGTGGGGSSGGGGGGGGGGGW